MRATSFTLAGVAFLFVVQFGCSQSAPTALPDNRAAIEQTIRGGEAAWVKDFQARDVEKVASHYSDDSTSMIPDMKLMTGKDAIRAGLQEEFADPNSSLDFHAAKVEVAKSEDLAYSQGTYTYTSTDPKTRNAMIEHGNYIEVYKKQPDGSWKAIEDIATQEAPPAPVKTAR